MGVEGVESRVVICPDGVVTSRNYPHQVPRKALPKYVLDSIKDHGDKICMVDIERQISVSYSNIIEQAKYLTWLLRSMEFGIGQVCCHFANNSVYMPAASLGVMATGGTFMPVDHRSTADELMHYIQQSGASVIITDQKCLATAEEVFVRCDLKKIIVFDELFRGVEILDKSYDPDYVEQFISQEIDVDRTAATFLHSSGTTGHPKAVMISHRSWLYYLSLFLDPYFIGFDSDSVVLMASTFSFIFPFSVMLATLVKGGLFTFLLKYDERTFLSAIEKYKITLTTILPHRMQCLAASSIADDYDLSSLRMVVAGGSKISAQCHEELLARFPHFNVIQAYGMTEIGAVTFTPKCYQNTLPGTCGIPLNGVQIKIVSPDGNGSVYGANETGELCVKHDYMMLGYYNNELATKSTIDDEGWLHTGDLAYYDDGGNIFVNGRIKETIKYASFQVSPVEIEDVLREHDAVVAVSVIGVPDKLYGELAKAYVVIREGQLVSTDELKQLVSERLSESKHLHGGLEFISDLPLSNRDKVLKSTLVRRHLGSTSSE